MGKIPIFDANSLERISQALDDPTGSELNKILKRIGVDNPDPQGTKWRRVLAALDGAQRKFNCGNHVVAFIQEVMAPVRYTQRRNYFEELRERLNMVLSFCGYHLLENGKLEVVHSVNTISEAEERANRLKKKLRERNVHSAVLEFCRSELLDDNYFHAVFEATKSVADKIREKSGLKSDGVNLVKEAFDYEKPKSPILAFNSLETKTEKSEHNGIKNLMKGIFGAFRNVTAHEPKIKWSIEEEDALDLLSIASFLHRRLDGVIKTPG